MFQLGWRDKETLDNMRCFTFFAEKEASVRLWKMKSNKALRNRNIKQE